MTLSEIVDVRFEGSCVLSLLIFLRGVALDGEEVLHAFIDEEVRNLVVLVLGLHEPLSLEGSLLSVDNVAV